jgi:hypothetical protein
MRGRLIIAYVDLAVLNIQQLLPKSRVTQRIIRGHSLRVFNRFRVGRYDLKFRQRFLCYSFRLPRSNSLTSLAALSPSARRSLSIFLDLSVASLSPVVLTAQPILYLKSVLF